MDAMRFGQRDFLSVLPRGNAAAWSKPADVVATRVHGFGSVLFSDPVSPREKRSRTKVRYEIRLAATMPRQRVPILLRNL